MKQIYLVPNIITAFGLACGLFVIFKVNMIEPGSGTFEMVQRAALLLLLAAFADFVDGAIARAFKAQSDFGVMFDSLSDGITFGVAPSVILLKTLSLEQGTLLSFIVASGAMVYSLCGVLRLVRFNIKSAEAKGNIVEMTLQKKNFTGLPIPAAAAATVSVNLFFLSPIIANTFVLSNTTRAIVLTCINIALGYLMLSKWKFPSLKGLHFKLPSFHLVFFAVLIAIFFLYGIFYYFSIVFAIASWGYVFIALLLSLIRLIAGKKSKTLEDFEPDDEEDEE
ncbi:MAG: CDP-alcohol phosphatidyltransferase family protein [Parachlamydiales bacterium]|nr:CDP-alcohol phosphatidyltransferase family protein [Parachlamydiales bacterium]